MKTANALLAAVAISFAAMTPASAAIISFGDWTSVDSAEVDPLVTIDDNTAGRFTFNISLDSGIGLLSGIFFDFGGSALTAADITGISGFTFGTNTNQLGGGVNVIPLPAFDYGIALSGQTALPLQFFVDSDAGDALADFTRIGLRFQSTGTDGEGSDKLVSSTVTVPEPGSLGLLAAGILGLVATRRFARQA